MNKAEIIQLGYPTMEDFRKHNDSSLTFTERGYAMVEGTNPDSVWELANWSCYSKKKPDNLHSELTHCNSDIIVHFENTDEWHCALSIGWKVAKSLEEAKEVMLTKSFAQYWPLINP